MKKFFMRGIRSTNPKPISRMKRSGARFSQHGGQTVLDAVSVQLDAGDRVGVVGRARHLGGARRGS